jgi:hypothetical protein
MHISTSKTSRRAVLAALASSPVAAMSTSGAASAAARDPIFNLLERHAAAKAAQEVAALALCRIEDEIGTWPGVDITVGQQPPANFRLRGDAEKWIDCFRPRHGRDAYEAEAAASLARFDRSHQAWQEKCEASGFSAAESAHDEAMDALSAAENAVLRSAPQTPAGAIALLLFGAEFAIGGLAFEDSELATILVNAARAVAGQGASFTFSAELKEALAA